MAAFVQHMEFPSAESRCINSRQPQLALHCHRLVSNTTFLPNLNHQTPLPHPARFRPPVIARSSAALQAAAQCYYPVCLLPGCCLLPSCYLPALLPHCPPVCLLPGCCLLPSCHLPALRPHCPYPRRRLARPPVAKLRSWAAQKRARVDFHTSALMRSPEAHSPPGRARRTFLKRPSGSAFKCLHFIP